MSEPGRPLPARRSEPDTNPVVAVVQSSRR